MISVKEAADLAMADLVCLSTWTRAGPFCLSTLAGQGELTKQLSWSTEPVGRRSGITSSPLHYLPDNRRIFRVIPSVLDASGIAIKQRACDRIYILSRGINGPIGVKVGGMDSAPLLPLFLNMRPPNPS